MSSNTVAHSAPASWLATFARRTPRRGLVVAWALCCLAFLALGALEIKGVVWFLLFALALAADIARFSATRLVTDPPTVALDERQQAVRNRVYRGAYLLVFYGMVLAVGGAMLLLYTGNEVASHWFSHPASHPVMLAGFGVATLQLVSLLPTAILAGTEQDGPGDLDWSGIDRSPVLHPNP